MVSKLRRTNGDSVWEPCAGKGDLIDSVLAETPPQAMVEGVPIISADARLDAYGITRIW